MSGASGAWSDIPADVVPEIMGRLELVDFIRLSSTCVSCRCLWKERGCRPKKGQIPWLMLPSPSHPDSRFFYSLSDQNKIFKIHLPQITGLHTVGSSEGFLITVDRSGELHTLNPLTGSQLFALPSTATHHGIVCVTRDSAGEIKIRGKPDLHRSMRLYYSKAIISPSLDTVVVIHGGLVRRLAFARAGDTSWAPLFSVSQIADMIFHKGRLYAINFSATVFTFDLDASTEAFSPNPRPGPDEKRYLPTYLVESPDGDELFLVLKAVDDGHSEVPWTTWFQVFKLKSNFVWEKVESIGHIAMFLGMNCSIAYDTNDFPCLKRNAIYFTYDYTSLPFPSKGWEGKGDSGVYSLEDGSIQLLCPSDDFQHIWPRPIWFTPILR